MEYSLQSLKCFTMFVELCLFTLHPLSAKFRSPHLLTCQMEISYDKLRSLKKLIQQNHPSKIFPTQNLYYGHDKLIKLQIVFLTVTHL